jgi:uncharacterized caspase-like protein
MKSVYVIVACALALHAHAAKRALLIGINDYSASRTLRDLDGATTDVDALRETLIERYGFEERDIVTLTNRDATRDAILRELDLWGNACTPVILSREDGEGSQNEKASHSEILRRASPAQDDGLGSDIILFYFSGHGSRVANPGSDEPDGMDEVIVAADGRDIHDKELRTRFNAILDRGALLTIILDSCFSGSGARGVSPRIALRMIPEERGALVFSAAQDFDQAWETRDDEHKIHGAFSWALVRAMRDASPSASASEVFLRAQARLRAETPLQQPVMSGDVRARLSPFLSADTPRSGERTFVFAEKVRRDGTAVVQGGRAHGLDLGSELRADDAILRITSLIGADRSEACIESGRAQPGMMFEVMEPRSLRDLRGPAGEARLELRPARNGVLIEGEQYELALHSPSSPRFVYVFAIDSRGESMLLFPRNGSVENRFGARQEVVLDARFEVEPPFGIETFVLLTSDEPLSDPWTLERDATRRGPPVTWSLETYVYQSVAAQKRHNRPSSVSEGSTSSPSDSLDRTLLRTLNGVSRRTRRSTSGGTQWRSTNTATMSPSRVARRSIHATLRARLRRIPESIAASCAARRS